MENFPVFKKNSLKKGCSIWELFCNQKIKQKTPENLSSVDAFALNIMLIKLELY